MNKIFAFAVFIITLHLCTVALTGRENVSAGPAGGKPGPNRIIVAGAGHGGLLCASILAQKGYEVEVYEKRAREDLGFDWHDNFHYEIFAEAGIDVTPAEYTRISDFTFISPDRKHILKTDIPPAKREIAMDRKLLIRKLAEKAEKSGAKIFFNSTVTGPYIENEILRGIYVNGRIVRGDLVIDSAGMESPLRSALPDDYGIQKAFRTGEKFSVYRAYYNIREGTDFDHEEYRVYFGIGGIRGIAWVRALDSSCDVLIGSAHSLPENTVNEIISILRADNPFIGDRIVRGGTTGCIPVRRPLDKLVGANYAVIGDAAAMTVPVIGSGIENSLRAAMILSSTVIALGKRDPYNGVCYSEKDLWNYQYEYYRKTGAKMCGLDVMKYFLFTVEWDKINSMFDTGLIKAGDLEKPLMGEEIVTTGSDMAGRFFKGWYRPGLLVSLKGMIDASESAKETAMEIPETSNPDKIKKWRERLGKYYGHFEEALNGEKK